MPQFQTLILFRGAAIALHLTPGPDMLYVAARRRRGTYLAHRTTAQIVALGLLFNTSGTLVNLAVAVLAGRATGWLRDRDRAARVLQRVTGGVFIALGLRLPASGRR